MATNPAEVVADLNSRCSVLQNVPVRTLAAASLGLQHSFSQAAPSTAQVATNHRSLCSFYQATTNLAQAADDLVQQ